jgi:hypothetical protein
VSAGAQGSHTKALGTRSIGSATTKCRLSSYRPHADLTGIHPSHAADFAARAAPEVIQRHSRASGIKGPVEIPGLPGLARRPHVSLAFGCSDQLH